jgi:hypothetical protein
LRHRALHGVAMSGSGRLPLLRATLALVVVADLLSFYLFLTGARADALAHGVALNALNDLVSRSPVKALIALIGGVAAVRFAGRAGRLWAGVVALAALTVLSTVHGQLYGSPWRHLFFSGLCLLGWLIGLAVSRRRGAPSDESFARVGSIALLGAAYFNSGISKIVYGGLDWISGFPIQVIVVGQDGLVADGILSVYRFWVATTPTVAALFSTATLVFELGGPLMILGPRVRRCIALGLLGMHANIYLLTDILYWESMVFLAVFGLFGDEPTAQTVTERAASIDARDRVFAGAAALLALGAMLAVGHQARRHARTYGGVPAVSAAPPAVPPTPPLAQIGPFAVGQVLAEEWAVESLALSDGGFVVALAGQPGRARFELTCAASDLRSPFDLGAAHIFYSSDLDVQVLGAPARAVQEQVRYTTGGQDICDQIGSWRRVAGGAEPLLEGAASSAPGVGRGGDSRPRTPSAW